jgi:sugar lactone lactonase YvrE
VTNFNGQSITEFSKSEWQADAGEKKSHPKATITISQDPGGHLDGPESILFDSAQNMWIGSEDGKLILVYSPEQYAASGNPTANVILNANSFKFSSPSHLRFDAAGDLWVVDEDRPNNQGGTGEIFRYDKDQITDLAAGNQNIDPVFGISIPGFVHLETIAFDAAGNLWEADQEGNAIYQFSASELSGTGLAQNLTPAVVLTPAHRKGDCDLTINAPYGIAIDGSGNLWVANVRVHGGCKGSIAEFSAGSIGSSGSPKPELFITTDSKGDSLDAPNALTFGPQL